MRQPIKLVIKKGKVRKDGTNLIFLQYCYSQTKRILIGSDIGIPENYWNRKTCSILKTLPKEYGDATDLEDRLREKLRHAEKLVDYALKNANTCPLRFLKRNFKQSGDYYLQQVGYDTQKLDVFFQIDKYIRDKYGLVQPSTLTTIRTMKKHLLCYQDHQKKAITFDLFNISFYEHFVRYLTFEVPLLRRSKLIKGLKINTVGKTIKHLKSFLKDRIARKVIPFMDLSFLKGMEEDVDAV